METKRIAFIGLGVMGAPMARNLAKVHDLSGFDVNPDRFEYAEGVKKVSSVEEAVQSAEVIILSLPSSAIVKNTVLGEKGIIDYAAEGSIIVDTSTTEPGISQEIEKALKEKGLHFLDAPVSGGEGAAIDGSLSFMVGGEKKVFEQCLPLFEIMGSSIVHVGKAGMGEVTKLVNNLIVGITFAALAEGFSLGAKSGIEPEKLYNAIRNGWAGSKVLDVAMPAILERNFKPGGTVDIHWKDLGYALSLAKEEDVPTPMTALAHEVFKAARADGKGKMSQPAIIQLWEKLLGITVQK